MPLSNSSPQLPWRRCDIIVIVVVVVAIIIVIWIKHIIAMDKLTKCFVWVLLLGYFRWLIEADAGRRVNLTLYDFTTSMASTSSRDHDVILGVPGSSSFCRRLAVVRDVSSGRETNICSGEQRIRHAYVSDGSRVEITMATTVNTATTMASDANAAHFLIRYEGWH